jgi:hypothetical protein
VGRQYQLGAPDFRDINQDFPKRLLWYCPSSEPEADPMTTNLEKLLEAARKVVPTPEEKEQQRRSFAYGNTKIENSRITREMVDSAADALGAPQGEPRRSE